MLAFHLPYKDLTRVSWTHLAGPVEWESQDNQPVKKKSDGPGNKIKANTSCGESESVTCPDGMSCKAA